MNEKTALENRQQPKLRVAEVSNPYFLCSKAVIDHFPEFSHSKPFKSGYDFEKDEDYYIAQANYQKVENYYKNVINPYNEKCNNSQGIDFWLTECVSGTMDVSKITLGMMRKYGLFITFEHVIGLTKNSNRAMIIRNLSEKFNCNPIELIDKIVK